MDSNTVSCGVCRCAYNKTDRLPRIIISCGDTICTACIVRLLGTQNSFECPFDKTKCFVFRRGIETFPVNAALMQLVERSPFIQTAQSNPLCDEHNEEARLFCINDNRRVCDECLGHDHKGHEVKSLKKIRAEAFDEKKRLEDFLENLEKSHKDMTERIDEGKAALVAEVQEKFGELKTIMMRKETELKNGIVRLFDIEKNRVEGSLGIESSLKSSVTERIVSLHNLLQNEDFSNAMSGHVGHKMDQAMLQREMNNFKDSLEKVRSTFSASLNSLIQSFDQIEFPSSEFSGSTSENVMQVETTIKRSTSNNKTFEDVLKVNELLRFEKKNKYLNISLKSRNNTRDAPEEPYDLNALERETKVMLKLGRQDITEEATRALMYIWRKFTSLTCLKIDYCFEFSSDAQFMSILPILAVNSKGVNKLEVNLERCRIGDQGISGFFETVLSQMTSLMSLNLNLKCTEITDKGLESFTKYATPILKKLETFKLFLARTKVTDQGMIPIFVRIDGLKSIALDLEFTKVTDSTIEALAVNTQATVAASLEEFELGISKTKVTDQSIIKLFVEMPKIQNFILSLGGTSIGNACIEGLAKRSLPTMKSLEGFELYLWETRVSDTGLVQLSANMEKVKRFKLYLGYGNVTDKSLFALSRNIMPSMKNLEDFELSIKNTYVTDEGISSIFVNMFTVRRFMLNLGSTNTSDRWLENFTKNALPLMLSLENFKVYLWLTKVTDQGLMKLFGGLRNLNGFSLYLQDTKVSDVSIEEFCRNKGKILKKNCEEFEIDLTRTETSDRVKAEVSNIRKKMLG